MGGKAAKAVQDAAEETIPAQENNQMTASEENVIEAEIVLDSEERAEMLAAIRDMDAGDEAFAGQY
ncbi:MAG TPA: hypothetical protein PKE69_28180 [Pyrinomonadaceae bacterium]|nr:hypothetical protein [Pyrinomonadaceae bacterium]